MLIFELDWRDLMEITMLSIGFYHFFSWLAADKESPLLIYCYRYGIIAFTCYLFSLHTIGILLLAGAPLWLMLLITFHRSSLQRNFVTARLDKKPTILTNNQWHHALIRSIAHHKNNNATFTLLLEQKQDLALLVTQDIACNTPFSHAFLSLIVSSKHHIPDQLIWLTQNGIIKAINAQWRSMESVDWYNAALVYTAQTDAIVLQSTPDQLVVIRNGTVEQNRSLTNLPHFFANLSSYPTHKGVS